MSLVQAPVLHLEGWHWLPVVSDAGIAAGLYLVSDSIAQFDEARKAAYDARRGLRFCFFGLLDGSVSHYWFNWLDDNIHNDDNTWLAISEKVCLDFLMFTPCWCVCFLFVMDILKKRTPKEAFQRVSKEWLDLYTSNVLLWLPANIAIYSIVPLDKRVLGFGSFNVMYTVLLSIWSEEEHKDSASFVTRVTRLVKDFEVR